MAQSSIGSQIADIGRGLGQGLGGLVGQTVGGIGSGLGQAVGGLGSGLNQTISGITNGSPWALLALGAAAYLLLHPGISPAGAPPTPATHPIPRQTGSSSTSSTAS